MLAGSPLGELCPACLIALAIEDQPASTDSLDDTFEGYRLLEKLGQGGMGVVWLAQQEHPVRRVVALKAVKPGGDSTQVLARFESERQALAMLGHPNIATIFHAGVTPEGRPYFAMEYVPGLPITTFADQHGLTIAARLELFLQVCEGIEHAHQKGVLHRDLKPNNILVANQDGRAVVKIIDFGVAKAIGPRLSAETMETEMGALLGTPEYMSPEQAGLTQSAVDTRTDIYSLGLVLYELLVGALPFDARELRRKAVIEMLRVIREDEPPRLTLRLSSQSHAEVQEIAKRRLTEPRTLVRQLRGDLEWITNRALEKEPARRYPSASELRADVRRHLSSEPVVAGPPDLRYRLVKLARKHRSTAIAAGLALIVLIVGAVVSTVLWINADRARRENRARLQTLHVTTGLQLATDGDDLKALPWLVRALQLEEGGPQAEEIHRIRIQHVLHGSPYPIRLWHHPGLVGAQLGPDRATLATWDRQGTVRIWDATRGESVGSPLVHPAPIVDVRLTQSLVVTGDEQGAIRVWEARTGRQTFGPWTHGPDLRLVRISPSGDRVLSAGVRGGIRVWALDSSGIVTAVQHDGPVAAAEFLADGGTFAAGALSGSVLVAETVGGRVTARLPHDSFVVSLTALGPNRLATATGGGKFRVWDLRLSATEGEPTRLIPNDTHVARVSPSGGTAFACGDEGASVVSLTSASSPRSMGTDANCLSVDVSAEALLVATGHASGAARVWSLSGNTFAPKLPHSAGVVLVGFLRDTRHLLSVDGDGVVRVWDLTPAAPPAPVARKWGYTWLARFSPDGRRLALASGTGSPPSIGLATVIDVATFETVLPPLRHGGVVRSVEFSGDRRLIATASEDGTARLWDAATGEPVFSPLNHGGRAKDVVFSPDGRRLLMLGPALSLEAVPASLWEVSTGRRLATLPESHSPFIGAFSPDGEHLVTVTRNPSRVQLWRSSDGRPLRSADWASFTTAAFVSDTWVAMAGPDSVEIRSLDGTLVATGTPGIRDAEDLFVTPDRSVLVVSDAAGAIHVWRIGAPMVRRFPLWRLPGTITAGAVSPDNRWFAGTSLERRAQVWSLQIGEPLTPVRTMPVLPLSTSFSPDGSRLQVSGRDATVWDLRPDPRSAGLLERISQLLSGHELVATQLVPLPVARSLNLASDRALLQSIATADDRNWRWLVADQHLSQRNWTAAEAELSRLARDPQSIWELRAAHGHALAELGRWNDAARAFQGAIDRRPDSTELVYYKALASAAGGEASAIDSACADALQKHGATQNPDRAHWLASLCVLAAATDVAARARVGGLARIAADLEPDLERFVSVYGAALLRAKESSRAAAVLEDVLKRQAIRDRGAETLLVLALAQRTLGQVSASARTLGRFDSSPLRAAMPLHRRLEAETWRRELNPPR